MPSGRSIEYESCMKDFSATIVTCIRPKMYVADSSF
jgi:hypothetical protein